MVRRREDPDRSVTVGADKAYDTAEFVRTCKAFGAEAHAARNTAGRRSNIGEEMAASEAYQASQVHRKRIEEVFGWVKTVARFSKTGHGEWRKTPLFDRFVQFDPDLFGTGKATLH